MSVAGQLPPANASSGVLSLSEASGDVETRTSVACDATDRGAKGAALVHRKQSFNTQDNAGSDNLRRVRYRRRSQSSRWLISDAIDASTIEEVSPGIYVDAETGELHNTDWVRPPRPARCGWRIGENVAVHSDGNMAHFSGTERCSSIWSCPVCSSVIRAERAREITKAVNAHHKAGGSILFVTLTIRHKKIDSLKQSLEAVLGSWKKLLQGGAWVGTQRSEGMKSRYAVSGYIRSTEVTYGQNGWHPHIHALFFTDRRLSNTEITTFGDELHTRWARFAKKATGRQPDREHGIDVQRVDKDGAVLGKYLSKIQDEGQAQTKKAKWDASAELARADVKKGRDEHFVPFELLDEEHSFPAPQRRRLWGEYVAYTRGRRAITWSQGLKDKYEVTEKTDDDIIEETESAPARWLVSGHEYDRIRRSDPTLLAVVLEAAEQEDWKTVALILPGQEITEAEPPDG